MAPRKELARGGGYTYLGARARQFLDAHTRAGVNARRSSAIGGRGGGQIRDTYRPRYHNNQRQHQGRGGTLAHGRCSVERPTLNDGRRHHTQSQGTQGGTAEIHRPRASGQPQARVDRDNIAGLAAANNSNGQGASSRMNRSPITPELDMNVNKRILAQTATPDSNARPIPQSALFRGPQSTQFTQSRHEVQSLFLPDTSSPGQSRELSSGSASNTQIGTPTLPPPPRRPVRPYRGKDEVKRAFTNAKLRAIMADKPYPKPKGKAGAEKPILKLGIRKEYK